LLLRPPLIVFACSRFEFEYGLAGRQYFDEHSTSRFVRLRVRRIVIALLKREANPADQACVARIW